MILDAHGWHLVWMVMILICGLHYGVVLIHSGFFQVTSPEDPMQKEEGHENRRENLGRPFGWCFVQRVHVSPFYCFLESIFPLFCFVAFVIGTGGTHSIFPCCLDALWKRERFTCWTRPSKKKTISLSSHYKPLSMVHGARACNGLAKEAWVSFIFHFIG